MVRHSGDLLWLIACLSDLGLAVLCPLMSFLSLKDYFVSNIGYRTVLPPRGYCVIWPPPYCLLEHVAKYVPLRRLVLCFRVWLVIKSFLY